LDYFASSVKPVRDEDGIKIADIILSRRVRVLPGVFLDCYFFLIIIFSFNLEGEGYDET
jgi:hypothetical protein